MHDPGSGPAALVVLCLHETGTAGAIWSALSGALAGHATVLAPDRPGWGTSGAPEGYARTTVPEQAGFAASILKEHGGGVVCGSGIGAAAALELSLAEPDLVIGTVLVEPPLLSFVPEATVELSADVAAIREVVVNEGMEAVLDAYLDGRLSALGPGAERLPAEFSDRGPRATSTLFAELSAVPEWERSDTELAASRTPAMIVVAEDSPPFLLRAGSELARVLGRSELREIGPGLPHTQSASELAALVVEIGDSLA
ncbi:MAG: alpha/beta hydrolase [Actinomycetota bacterium]|nr:alpha/beta hydrolase [Actinomycetota bacterium]